jgi:serine/threonine protein kinase
LPAEASDASLLPRRFGTYGYRAPEVEAGSRPAAPAADVWSLGIVLAHEALELLAGPSACQLLLQQNLPHGLACLESLLGPQHPLCDLVRRMLREAPEERPTCRQLLQHPFVRTCTPACGGGVVSLRARRCQSRPGRLP